MNVRTSIQRWGNSLALRIPKTLATQAALEENSAVELRVQGNALIIRPTRKEWRLDELVAGITARNRHRPTDWGTAVGKEVW